MITCGTGGGVCNDCFIMLMGDNPPTSGTTWNLESSYTNFNNYFNNIVNLNGKSIAIIFPGLSNFNKLFGIFINVKILFYMVNFYKGESDGFTSYYGIWQ